MTVTLPRVGEEVAGYGLRAVLGRGGMSVVYEAEHRRLGSTIALKVLAPELASDDVFRARFLKESRIAASLNHPNVIPIYDVGPWEDLLYISMRYVSGADLRTVLKAQGRLIPAQAMLLIAQGARALDAAHRHDLVHRDVKPANFLVERGADDDPDHVYLADFGITKHALSRSGLTATGQFVGTIDYIAPEQIQDKPVDGRADIYSLGCVLYECLTGQVPFKKSADAAVIWAHVEESPMPPSAVCPELPHSVDEVIARALAKDPNERFDTCRGFVAAAGVALGEQALAHGGNGAGGQQTVLRGQPPAPPAPAVPGPADLSGTGRDRPPAAPPLRPPGEVTGVGSAGAGQPHEPQPGPRTGGYGGGSEGAAPPSGVSPVDGGAVPDDYGSHHAPDQAGFGARHRRRPLILLAVVAVALIGGGVAWAVAGSGSSKKTPKSTTAARVQSPLLAALGRANQSMTAKGLLPPSSCKAQSASMVVCTDPSFAIQTASFQTYPSLTALYAAYVANVKSLNGGAFQSNFGECTPNKTNGEVSWNHNYEHPRIYSLADTRAGMIRDDKAAGRAFCTFSNSKYHLVWTMNDGHMLATLTGAPHDDAFSWWHGVHHAIDLRGATHGGNMQMSNGHM